MSDLKQLGIVFTDALSPTIYHKMMYPTQSDIDAIANALMATNEHDLLAGFLRVNVKRSSLAAVHCLARHYGLAVDVAPDSLQQGILREIDAAFELRIRQRTENQRKKTWKRGDPAPLKSKNAVRGTW